MKTIIDTSSVPCNLEIGNPSDELKQFNLYPDNSEFALGPGESIIYKVQTAREYIYYYVTCNKLGLSLVEVETTTEGE
jgi:hypothetical protein